MMRDTAKNAVKKEVAEGVAENAVEKEVAEETTEKLVKETVEKTTDDIAKTVTDVEKENDFKFSRMSEEQIQSVIELYRMKAPLNIPKTATARAKSMKDGYEQISYKWTDGGFKYEARWHTRTSGAPESQGNTWVIQRKKPGSGAIKPYSEFLTGENEWTAGYKWYDAISARKSGTATPEQKAILDKGHWKE